MEWTEMNFASFSTQKVVQVKIPFNLLNNQLRYLAACNKYNYSLPNSKPMANKLLLDEFEVLTSTYVPS